jgi:aromatic ring-opening dioxygenase LigB subunit
MSWSWAALMPHPPVIVPEVGRGREREAAVTLKGVTRLMERLSGRRPEALLLLSPHQPYARGGIFVNAAARPRGSLALFQAPVAFDLTTSERLPTLGEHLRKKGFTVRAGESPDLTRDQGSLVPLYFLRKAWGDSAPLPPVVLASPIGLDLRSALRLGEVLASFDDGAAWGLLASGDLSHRLTPDAPAGYSPMGKRFDAALVAALDSLSPEGLLALSPQELEDAGECGLRSVAALLGLCQTLKRTIETLSYEGPFGVGYCNAFAELAR